MGILEGSGEWDLLCNCVLMIKRREALKSHNGCLWLEDELVSFLESTPLRFGKRGGK